MAGVSIQTRDLRLVFDNAKQVLSKNGLDPQKAILTQSYLRAESYINANVSRYQMSVLIDDNYVYTCNAPTEKRLALQDAFVISHIGFKLGWQDYAAPTAQRNYVDYTYPSQVSIDDQAEIIAGGWLAYQGNLSWLVNQRTLINSWDLQRHLVVPFAQNAPVPGAGNLFPIQINSYNGAMDGFYPCEPNLYMSGGKKNDIYLNMPVPIPAANLPAPATAQIKLILMFYGVLAQNVTNVR